MAISNTYLTIQDFFELPEKDRPLELVNGQAIAKMSPKYFHSRLQKTLLFILDSWAKNRGRIEIVKLKVLLFFILILCLKPLKEL